jgi:hypothetical protein
VIVVRNIGLPRSPRIAHGSLRDHSLSRRSTTNLLIFLISAGVNARATAAALMHPASSVKNSSET